MIVKEIFIYPIKSLGGISVPHSKVAKEGLEFDRRMMLVDKTGRFLSQRETSKMALIGAEFEEKGFNFYSKNNPEEIIFIPHEIPLVREVSVSVWESNFTAMSVEDLYSDWFRKILNIECTLVKMNSQSERIKQIGNSEDHTLVSTADGYPYLIISEASLVDLNKRMKVSIPMDRFRPNIVLENCLPYEEENLVSFSICDSKLKMVKPCARCVVTTIDQKTGKKLVEPLKTLSTYKRAGNNTLFGMNAICIDQGEIRVGDEIVR